MTKVTIRGSRTSDTIKVEIDGKELTCCSKIVIDPIVADGLITASITVLVDELDLEFCDAVFIEGPSHE